VRKQRFVRDGRAFPRPQYRMVTGMRDSDHRSHDQ
jgi:hypothetical protein